MSNSDAVQNMTDGYDELLAGDQVLRRIAAEHGRPDPFHWPGSDPAGRDPFVGLLLHITGQQISTVAALAIFGRIQHAAGRPPDPTSLLALGPERLRALGLSAAKVASILQLASRVNDGQLDLDHLDQVDDASVTAALVAVRGIGPWTAEMFLIHQLLRPDVLPAGDLGIRRGVQLGWMLDTVPTEEEVRARGSGWAPWRTYAAALLWASLPTGPTTRSTRAR